MTEKRLVHVTFDETRGYVATGADLPLSGMVSALSLSGLRRRLEALSPDGVEVILSLDKAARRERDQRRKGGQAAGIWPRMSNVLLAAVIAWTALVVGSAVVAALLVWPD